MAAPGRAARPAWRRLLAIPTPLVFAVSVVVAIALLWRSGALGDLAEAARRPSPAFLAGVFMLYLAGLALLCLRWHALVLMAGGAGNVPRAAEAFLTSVVVNYAAPIGLAVPTRAALSARDLGLSAGAGAAVAFWEVVLDVAVLAAISLGWLAFGGGDALRGIAPSPPILLAAASVAAAALALAAVVGARRPGVRRRIGVAAGGVLRYPLRRPVAAGAALALALAYWTLQAVVLRLLLDAVGVGRGPEAGLVLGLLAAPTLIGMLSPVPGGAGVREVLMVAVAQTRGVDAAAVLIAAVAYRVALFVAIPPLFLALRLWRVLAGRRTRSSTDD